MGVCSTRHWQTFGRLVQALLGYTLCEGPLVAIWRTVLLTNLFLSLISCLSLVCNMITKCLSLTVISSLNFAVGEPEFDIHLIISNMYCKCLLQYVMCTCGKYVRLQCLSGQAKTRLVLFIINEALHDKSFFSIIIN